MAASQIEVPHVDKLRAQILPAILVNVPLVANMGGSR